MKRITTFLLLALVSSCAISQPISHQPMPTEATFAASKDDVWTAVMSEIALNYRVQTLDKESGFLAIATTHIPIGPSRPMTHWVLMPNILFGSWEVLSLSMNILVEEEEENLTRVTVKIGFEAYENRVFRAWIPCETNGRMEQTVLLAIENRLKS